MQPYLSRILDLEERLSRARVDSYEHAAHLDRQRRMEELDNLAKDVAYAVLSSEDRQRFLNVINISKGYLKDHNNPDHNNPEHYNNLGHEKEKNSLIYLLAVIGCIVSGAVGWMGRGMYDAYKAEEDRKLAEKVKELMKVDEK